MAEPASTARPFPEDIPVPDEVVRIVSTLEDAGHEAWCVGGAIRDTLLEQAGPNTDYDVATSATPDAVQQLFRHTVAVGLRYGTIGVLDRNRVLHEVTTFRHDVKTYGRKAEVAFGASLEEDLARRDFTINAIAWHPIKKEWRDPFNGAEDLDRKVIRAVGDPVARFREDYLRILRAIRFCARLGFTIDRATWDAAVEAVDGLADLSAERVRDEWFKGLTTAISVTRLVKLWNSIGAADVWLSELAQGESPVAAEVEDAEWQGERDPVVMTALVCVDPVAVLQRLKASNEEIARAVSMVAGPSEPAGTNQVETRRWLALVGSSAEDLAMLWRARRGAPFPWSGTIAEIRERGDPLTRGDLAIDGDDLMKLGVPAGPEIGRTLERLLTAVVDDPGLNTRETLERMALEAQA